MIWFLIGVFTLFVGAHLARKKKIIFAAVVLSSAVNGILYQIGMILVGKGILARSTYDDFWFNIAVSIVTLAIAYGSALFISKRFGS